MASHARCATINVNGLHNDHKRIGIFQSLKRLNFDIIALQETKADLAAAKAWMVDWGSEEGWESYWSVSSRDARGVAFLFSKNLKFEVLDVHAPTSGRFLRVDVNIDGSDYQLINVYGIQPRNEAVSEHFFQGIADGLDFEHDVIMFGDFNMVHDFNKDRKGGTPTRVHTYGLATLSSQILIPFDLVDVWRDAHPDKLRFTYHTPDNTIHSRLDRIYVPKRLTPFVSSSYITHFVWSDHDMCVMNVHFSKKSERGPGYYKLNLGFLEQPSYVSKISGFWNQWRRQKTRHDLATWWDLGKMYIKRLTIEHAHQTNSSRKERVNALLHSLEDERSNNSPSSMFRVMEIQDELMDIEVEANKHIFTHTHTEFREVDEVPTRYFYALLKVAQDKVAIEAVKDDKGTLLTSQDDMRREIKSFYETLFKRETTLSAQYQTFFLSQIKRRLSPADRGDLEAVVTEEELYDALIGAKKGKVPGFDGLPYEFYLTMWDTMKGDLLEIINHILFHADKMPTSMRRSVITLLYKRGDSTLIKNWRPVSLLCCDYKLMTKILNNRLKKVLDSIISPSQQSGIAGRTIFNNLHLMRDVIDYCQARRVKGFILSVDQEKAFDKVDRDFLYAVLHRMGFGPNFIRAIRTIYTENFAHVLVNGFMSESFPVERSAKQGCSVSSNLYAIYIEPLALAIQSDKQLVPLPLPGPPVVIMQIADDMEIFLSERASVRRLYELFREFKMATGSTVNEEKTEGLLLGNPSPSLMTSLDPFRILWKNSDGMKVLGILFFTDFTETQRRNWIRLKEEMQEYLSNSRSRLLSLKGRVLVLNTVVLARIWYMATVITPLKEEKNAMIRLIFDFLWQIGLQENRCKDPIKRNMVYQPRDKGGLNLKNMDLQIKALQLKFTRDIVDPDCTHPWVHLARFWIGFRLAPLHPDWTFLRNNNTPHLNITANVPSSFYKDLLRDVRGLDLTDFEWLTPAIYRVLMRETPEVPKAWEFWQFHGGTLSRLFTHVHRTPARGSHQDVMYKYIHRIHATAYFKFIRFSGGDNFGAHTRFCARCPTQVENLFHCFISCPAATRVWDVIYPTLEVLHRGGPFRISRLLINTHENNLPIAVRRMITTILQIALHRIWINRNTFTKESRYVSLNQSLAQIKLEFNRAIRKQFVRLPLVKFREQYCHTPDVCRVENDTTLVTNVYCSPNPGGYGHLHHIFPPSRHVRR